jgi:ankyrin repeat protein
MSHGKAPSQPTQKPPSKKSRDRIVMAHLDKCVAIPEFFGYCELGQTDKVKELLNLKADPNHESRFHNGVSPLMIAAENGHSDIVEALLKANADPNLPALDGTTTLFMAVQFGRSKVIELLLEYKAEPNRAVAHSDKTQQKKKCVLNGVTDTLDNFLTTSSQDMIITSLPLTMSFLSLESSKEITQILLDAKADPNRVDRLTSLTPLETAVRVTETYSATDPSVPPKMIPPELITLLLENKGDPVHINPVTKNSPLFFAFRSQDPSMQKKKEILLNACEHPDTICLEIEKKPYDILSVAYMMADYITLERLITKYHVHPNIPRPSHGRLLFTLPFAPDTIAQQKTINTLIALKGDPFKIALNPEEAVFVAIKLENVPLLRALLTLRPDYANTILDDGITTPLVAAARSGNKSLISTLIEFKADPHAKNASGTPILLISAVSDGHPTLADALIQLKPEPNFKVPNNGSSALMIATTFGYETTVKALLAIKANPNLQDNEGKTAFHYACRNAKLNIAKTLLENGANPHLLDNDGLTAIDYVYAFWQLSGEGESYKETLCYLSDNLCLSPLGFSERMKTLNTYIDLNTFEWTTIRKLCEQESEDYKRLSEILEGQGKFTRTSLKQKMDMILTEYASLMEEYAKNPSLDFPIDWDKLRNTLKSILNESDVIGAVVKKIRSQNEKILSSTLSSAPKKISPESAAKHEINAQIQKLKQEISALFKITFPLRGYSLGDQLYWQKDNVGKFVPSGHSTEYLRAISETIRTKLPDFEEEVRLLTAENISADNLESLKERFAVLSATHKTFKEKIAEGDTLIRTHGGKKILLYRDDVLAIPALNGKTKKAGVETILPKQKSQQRTEAEGEPKSSKQTANTTLKKEVEPPTNPKPLVQAAKLSADPKPAKIKTPSFSLSLAETLDTIKDIIHGEITFKNDQNTPPLLFLISYYALTERLLNYCKNKMEKTSSGDSLFHAVKNQIMHGHQGINAGQLGSLYSFAETVKTTNPASEALPAHEVYDIIKNLSIAKASKQITPQECLSELKETLENFRILKENYEFFLSVMESTNSKAYNCIFKLYSAAFSMIIISLGETWQTIMNCLPKEESDNIKRKFSKKIAGNQPLKNFLDTAKEIRDAVSHEKIVQSQLFDVWFSLPNEFFIQANSSIDKLLSRQPSQAPKSESSSIYGSSQKNLTMFDTQQDGNGKEEETVDVPQQTDQKSSAQQYYIPKGPHC